MNSILLAQYSNNSPSAPPIDPLIFNLVEPFISIVLSAVLFFSFVGFFIALVLYLTAAGEDEKRATAKNFFLLSVWGVVIAILGTVILNLVGNYLGR